MAQSARGFAICTTQRSGSTYLCQLLSSTGVLGLPLDYFNAAGRRAKGWAQYPEEIEEQVRTIVAHGSTANAVYGFKVFAQHLDALAPTDWTTRLPNLQWVHLRRDDLLDQAISLLIAKQTGQWRSGAPSYDDANYDAGAIRSEMTELARDDARWQWFFAERGLRPLQISYDTLTADPQGVVRAVAALMGVDEAVSFEPSQVTVEVQRSERNLAWKTRFMKDELRPRLSVSIITKDSEQRLPRLLAEASQYADEIVVGVDASSADRTREVALAGADVVYEFRLAKAGQLAPARMLPFRYATGDWILSLDDDESMDSSFDALAPELMRAAGVTHYFFPRKWITSENPPEYVHADPWYPNWAPRLFRNDRTLVWKPAQAHSMYRIQGPGYHEARTSILHFEPLWCTPEQRRVKLEAYRNSGAAATSEYYYSFPADAPRRPVRLRDPAPPRRNAAGSHHREVHELVAAPLPPWGSAILGAEMPATARVGTLVVAELRVRNTGGLAWLPTHAELPAAQWPLIRLAYHLFDAGGRIVDGDRGRRTPVVRFVAPGDELTLIALVPAPAVPGEYTIEWDMVSEGECWFAECGATVFRSQLTVTG